VVAFDDMGNIFLLCASWTPVVVIWIPTLFEFADATDFRDVFYHPASFARAQFQGSILNPFPIDFPLGGRTEVFATNPVVFGFGSVNAVVEMVDPNAHELLALVD
jgi:hypothetical protein